MKVQEDLQLQLQEKICEVGDEAKQIIFILKVLEVDKMRVSKVFIKILEEENKEEE